MTAPTQTRSGPYGSVLVVGLLLGTGLPSAADTSHPKPDASRCFRQPVSGMCSSGSANATREALVRLLAREVVEVAVIGEGVGRAVKWRPRSCASFCAGPKVLGT